MSRDPRYDILFEPVAIGPVTAKNRFYQVPHCTGMAANWPSTSIRYREIKAEGGWGVVCTEECMVHPSADHAPSPYMRLWDEADVPPLALSVEGIHRHGGLAGVELCHAGISAANRMSREVPLSPSGASYLKPDPVSAKAMTRQDIRDVRRWHKNAALLAKRAGFDIVYVYAGHDLSIAQQFLVKRYNRRTDEYGGSLENRVRLLRELIEDTKEAVGDTCAVALRFSVDELMGEAGLSWDGEGGDIVEMLAELPDLWDVNVSDWPNDSGASRFFPEGYQTEYTAFVKSLTTKPVVGVGRFTSPDAMVAQIKKGYLDMIGAARPSIADPFLPRKIEEGRLEDIRECIGCNMCTSGQLTSVPMRCTQNPTAGEEWRRGWHPEVIAPKGSDDSVLVVGAGPAGLECAMALGQRGYTVMLAEAGTTLGGRVAMERQLPGLSQWGRVADYRIQQLQQMRNVDIYFDSPLTPEQILDYGVPHVVIAAGSTWRPDGIGPQNYLPVPGSEAGHVLTPEQVVAGVAVEGPVVVFDDDQYYLGGVVAEKLARDGHAATLVTPGGETSAWCRFTLEWPHVQRRLSELGITVINLHTIGAITPDTVTLSHIFTETTHEIACHSVVMVSSRAPNTELYESLQEDTPRLESAGIKSLTPIGDCLAPGSIAMAVYAGHRFARELDTVTDKDMPFRLERMPDQ